MLSEGDDLGKWLQRQKNPGTWAQLSTERQERLTRLGVKPLEAASPAPAVVDSSGIDVLVAANNTARSAADGCVRPTPPHRCSTCCAPSASTPSSPCTPPSRTPSRPDPAA
ncbi:helicase associated domain-containing protein [Streptomyces sp. NPDC003016]